MNPRPIRPLLALALACALGLLLYAAGSSDDFPGRRQGGGSHSEFPAEVDYGA